MAIKIPIITELQDEGIKKAKREFDKFKGAVAGAEGGMGKFKAGSKAIFDGIQANAAAFATAAAGAFVTFAAQGVTAFQELALSADKFAGATGLAVEEASRLMEVAGDLGIEAGTVETAIGKMNQNLGKSPDLFEELGVQVEYAKDGTVDANETFLNVIDRLNKIKDPAEKARVATQLLGKGWRDMSNLIQLGSDDLRKSLSQVSDAKTISPEEAAKAKKFRDNMDNLKDTIEDLSLQIGEVLVPAIADAVEQIEKLNVPEIGGGWFETNFGRTPTQKYVGNMKLVQGALELIGFSFGEAKQDEPLISDEEVNNMQMAATDLENANQQTLNQIKYGRLNPFKGTTDSAKKLSTELENIDKAWQNLVDRLTAKTVFDEATTSLTRLEEAAADAFGAPTQENLATYNEQAAQFAGLLATIAGNMGAISSMAIKLRFELDGPAAALDLAKWLAGGAEYGNLTPSQRLGEAGLSIGSPLPPLNFGAPTMTPTSGTSSNTGNTFNVTVTSADPTAVVRALQDYNRQSGPVPVTTRQP